MAWFNKKNIWLLFGLLLLALSQSAYVLRAISNFTPTTWQAGDFPILIEVWQGVSDDHPSIHTGSNPLRALQEAVERWARTSSMTISLKPGSFRTDIGQDGVNLITIADTSHNRDVIGQYPLGVTQSWHQGARLVETDILLNPGYNWSTRESDGAWNMMQTILHEFGHGVGLSHSINRDAVMYNQGGYFGYDFNRLTWDEIAAVNAGNRMVGIERITGSIAGRVTMSGRAVFGAFIVAVDENGVTTASTVSMPDGNYRIECLPPGKYTLYAEPLDGPTEPQHISLGQISTSGMETNFRPQFYSNNAAPLISVYAGGSSRADFQVRSGRTVLNPRWLRIDADPFQSGQFGGITQEMAAGTNRHLGLAGDGVGQLQDQAGAYFLGSHVKTRDVSRSARSSTGVDFKWYPIEVPEEAPEGAYSVFLRGAGQEGVQTGTLQVTAPYRHERNFAHFVDLSSSIRSEVFVLNHATWTGQGRLLSRTADGQERPFSYLDRENNSYTSDLRLAPSESVWLRTDGSSGVVGSLRAQLTAPLAASVVIETPFGTTGLPPSKPLLSFIAPVEIRENGTRINSGVALTNFEKRDAEIFLQLHDQSGRVLASTVIELLAGGQTARFVPELLATPQNLVGTLRVTANRRIGATIVRTAPNVFTTLPVIENRVVRENWFAQFAHGRGIRSQLLLVNPSTSKTASNVTIQLLDSSGRPTAFEVDGQAVPTGSKRVSIAPQGMIRLTTSGASTVVGALKVTSDVPVGGVVLFESDALGTAGVGESAPSRSMVLPLDYSPGDGRNTGLALVNTESRPVNVQVTVKDGAGRIVEAPISFQLLAGEHRAAFPGQYPFEIDLPDGLRGSLWIEADGEIASTALRQSPGVLTTFPTFPLDQAVTPSR